MTALSNNRRLLLLLFNLLFEIFVLILSEFWTDVIIVVIQVLNDFLFFLFFILTFKLTFKRIGIVVILFLLLLFLFIIVIRFIIGIYNQIAPDILFVNFGLFIIFLLWLNWISDNSGAVNLLWIRIVFLIVLGRNEIVFLLSSFLRNVHICFIAPTILLAGFGLFIFILLLIFNNFGAAILLWILLFLILIRNVYCTFI